MPERLTNLYITEQGASLHKRNEMIVCEKDEEEIVSRPLKDVGLVVLFGAVQVSTQALLALLENGSDVSLMTHNGHFRGRLTPALGKNSDLRMKQYQRCSDKDFCLRMGKNIITAKVSNCLKLMKDYHYSASNPIRFDSFKELESLEKRLQEAETMESLRGYEGAAARWYFRGFADALTCGVKFPGRRFHPSTDPVNALLSFGYSFVAREIQGLIEAMGIDPYIGVYHDITYGRASLSLDILEEFRHHLVDRLTLKLFNKRIIETEDFEVLESDGGWYLKRDTLKAFIKHYEETVNAPDQEYQGGKHSYRHIFREQAALLRHAFLDNIDYIPYKVSS